MNVWKDTVLTDKGAALQAKLLQGQTLKITGAKTGAASVPPVNLRRQTSVTEGGGTATLQPARTEGDQTIIPVLLENTDLVTGYELWQVGFYAEDPDEGEILYCIAQASKGKDIPSASESPGFSITWDFYFQTSSEVPFEVVLNSNGLVNIEQHQIHSREIENLKCIVGDLDSLRTEEKTNLVESVNEINGQVDSLDVDLTAASEEIKKINTLLSDKANQSSLNSTNSNLNALSSQVNYVKGMKMDAGAGTISSVGQAYKTQRVNYNVAFRSNPGIVVGLNKSAANRFVCVGTHDPSGFNVNAYCTQGTADVYYTWIAIGFV
ncbi:hypothetical protein [Anaerostipes sp.]|uniref:hypothetical protein n=1 Tax=Anaerostipes sp. TaxID=1872530 RepID=UPI0025BEFE16|nr:hypothetical protein [Anaerostipes sp.]